MGRAPFPYGCRRSWLATMAPHSYTESSRDMAVASMGDFALTLLGPDTPCTSYLAGKGGAGYAVACRRVRRRRTAAHRHG